MDQTHGRMMTMQMTDEQLTDIHAEVCNLLQTFNDEDCPYTKEQVVVILLEGLLTQLDFVDRPGVTAATNNYFCAVICRYFNRVNAALLEARETSDTVH